MAKNVKINGVTYENVPQVDIPLADNSGDNAVFYDTSGDDAAAGNILAGKKAHGADGGMTGTMANNGAVVGAIANKAQSVSIAEGYHNGNGAVAIDATEQAKIISDNIKSGVTVLGVPGKGTVVDTEIPSDGAGAAHILSGKKAYVGGQLVTGSMTAATVSQDSTTKVLSIS